jgi:hypothetical protein
VHLRAILGALMNTKQGTIKGQTRDILQEINHVAKQLDYESLESIMQKFTRYGTSEQYDEWLNEVYGEIEICGFKYYASYAFKEVDPIAYGCGYGEYWSYLLSDGEYIEYEQDLYRVDELTAWLETHEELRPKTGEIT